MDKLLFEFTLLPSPDGKSNIYSITSITTDNGKMYAIPNEFQAAGTHTELIKTPAYGKVKNSLKKRYQKRRVWITMTPELSKIYIDEDNNIQFGDQFLEEIDPTQQQQATAQKTETSTLEKILEKLLENSQNNAQQSLKQLTEKFIIEKFSSQNPNANQWIDTFEKECTRLGITTDEKKIEVLRLFLDKSCTDWYSSMVIKLTMNAEWSEWRLKFCETFANKGWSPVTYAINYKHKSGSLLDYAMRKEKALLDMRRTIDKGSLVDLVAAGLPSFVLNRIDRETLNDTVDLFNEISKYEHMVSGNKTFNKKKDTTQRSNYKVEEKKPCQICEKLNKGTRYHPMENCWFKPKEDKKEKKDYIRHVNNSEIEATLNDTEEKNE